MLARYVQKGDAIDYRPTEAVAAGDVVIIADLIGIARLDIEANTLGSLAVVGVFDVVRCCESGRRDSFRLDGLLGRGSEEGDHGQRIEPLPRQGHCGCGGGRRYGSCASQRPVQPRDDLLLLNAPYSLATTFAAGDPIMDLTDNSGGTPSDTIPVLACESGCDCKHAVASLTKKTNTILAALRAVGIIASE